MGYTSESLYRVYYPGIVDRIETVVRLSLRMSESYILSFLVQTWISSSLL